MVGVGKERKKGRLQTEPVYLSMSIVPGAVIAVMVVVVKVPVCWQGWHSERG